jgi:hypothetical protein
MIVDVTSVYCCELRLRSARHSHSILTCILLGNVHWHISGEQLKRKALRLGVKLERNWRVNDLLVTVCIMCANPECFSLGMRFEFSENSRIMETERPAQVGTRKERFLPFSLVPFPLLLLSILALLGPANEALRAPRKRRNRIVQGASAESASRPAMPFDQVVRRTLPLPPPPSHCLLPGKLNAVLIHGAMRTHRRRVSLFQRRATVRSSSSSLTSIS